MYRTLQTGICSKLYSKVVGKGMGRAPARQECGDVPMVGHKLVYGFLTLYMTASVPLHAQTFISQSTDYILAFPDFYGYIVLPIMTGLPLFVWRLRFQK